MQENRDVGRPLCGGRGGNEIIVMRCNIQRSFKNLGASSEPP